MPKLTLWFSHHILNLVGNPQCNEIFSTRIPCVPCRSDIDRYTHVQSLHRSHSTDDMFEWLKVLKNQDIHASCFALRLTMHRTPAQVLSHQLLLCYCRPLLRIQMLFAHPFITVKIHGMMVLLRKSTPPHQIHIFEITCFQKPFTILLSYALTGSILIPPRHSTGSEKT